MLPLDHIPFYGEPDAMGEAFARLGFTVSPPGEYTTPDHPGVRWPSRSVFLRQGWFDLLSDDDAQLPGAPGAILFRGDDPIAPELAALRPQSPQRLERRWSEDVGRPTETFAFSSLKSRIAPLGIAAIAHAWPCVDILPEWFEHPNGAMALTGMVFGQGKPGPMAAAAAEVLDLSGFEYWARPTFAAAFPRTPVRYAVKVRVADLARARAALKAGGAKVRETAGSLCVPAQFGLMGGFLFSV